MKTYEIYRDIRKKALIMGLPISLFAIMMTSVIGSLLFVIFSFSLGVIVFVSGLNTGLYIVLTNISKNPTLWHLKREFPDTVSNKEETSLHYEEN